MDADGDIFRLAPDPQRARADAEQLYREVSHRLIRLLPTGSEIMHVGATAIADCLTKGDLDVMVRVDPSEFDEACSLLSAIYDRSDSASRSDFIGFEDKERTPHLGVQLIGRGGSLDVFELFRNRLNESSALLREYNALKRAHDGQSMDLYRAAKDRFIARTIRY